jgi:mannose-1-phosphate guanylyltransferase
VRDGPLSRSTTGPWNNGAPGAPCVPVSAIVLTAGLGTRLDPLTRLVAKPAVPLAGRPLLGRVLDWLGEQGVRDVILNLHHRPETITAIVGDGSPFGLRARYSWEPVILGSAGGPRHALPLLDADPLLIVNGDTLCEVPLGPFCDAHRRLGAEVTMALVPNPAPDHYNGVVLDDEDQVIGFRSKGRAEGTWHFVGIQIAAASIFAGLGDGEPAETVAGIYRDMVARRPGSIRGWRLALPFIDVGTPRDYLEAALALAAGQPPDVLVDPDVDVEAGVRLVDTIVWPGATIGAGAHLGRCIVAGQAQVPRGLTARDAVIVPASVVREGDRARIEGEVGVFELD